MHKVLAGVSLLLLAACGSGLPGFPKESKGGGGDSAIQSAVESGDAEPLGCLAAYEGEEEGDLPIAAAQKAKKEKKVKEDKAKKGGKSDENDEDESDDDTGGSCSGGSNPQDGGTTVPPPSGASVSYTKDVAPIMTASCVSCHRAGKADAGIALDSLASTKGNIDATISSIEGGRMPIGNVPPVSDAQLNILKQWKAAGFPN